MQVQAGFFTPGSQGMQALYEELQRSVHHATGCDTINSVEIAAKFNTPKKTDQLFERFRFIYGFPKTENGMCKVVVDHMQDPDGPTVTREEIETREVPEKEMCSELSSELKTMSGSVSRIARIYKFFMDVSTKLLHATRLRELDIVVTDSKGLFHISSFAGNFGI